MSSFSGASTMTRTVTGVGIGKCSRHMRPSLSCQKILCPLVHDSIRRAPLIPNGRKPCPGFRLKAGHWRNTHDPTVARSRSILEGRVRRGGRDHINHTFRLPVSPRRRHGNSALHETKIRETNALIERTLHRIGSQNRRHIFSVCEFCVRRGEWLANSFSLSQTG